MKFAYHQTEDCIVVFAAETIKEFDNFKSGDHTFSAENVSVPDMIEMFGDPQLRKFGVGPVIIHDVNPELITANDIKIVAMNRTMTPYEEMMDRAKLEAEMGLDEMSDRRTIAEVLGIDKYDPWSDLSAEEQAEQQALNEKMKAERLAGTLSEDSFSGSVSENGKIIVREVDVEVDAEGELLGAKVKASRSEISPYEITVSDHTYDLDGVLAKLRVPLNRVLEVEPGRAVVRLHSFQISQLERLLAGDGVTNFTIVGEEAEEEPAGAIQNFAPGYKEGVFFVCSSELDISATKGLLTDLKGVIVEHLVDNRAWLVCLRRRHAERMVDELMAQQIDAMVVAVNKLGLPIIDPTSGFKVIDDGEEREIGPRPWDEDLTAFNALTDEEREAELKKIGFDEFMFAARDMDKNGYKSRVWITPVAYFQRTDELWTGFLPMDRIAPPNNAELKHVGGAEFMSRSTPVLIRNGLANVGLRESMMLHLYLNDRDEILI